MPGDSKDLVDFVAAMGGERSLKVEENYGDGFVRLRVAEAERRQAKHDIRCVEDVVIEMLRNSRDAGAQNIFVATTREGNVRTTTILDDGCGIPDDMHERIFEARVTSKLESVHMDRWGIHGRGMALYSVRENAESAEVVSSEPGKGSAIRVVTNAKSLGERKDQSTWPSLGKDEDGKQTIATGPHNIIRTCCEFALEERGRCAVYIGSPAEIVSTIRRRVTPSLDGSALLFVDDLSELPVLERIPAAADAGELIQVARSLGLEMSERTAHRIIAGQIKPQRNVLSKMTHKSDKSIQRAVDLMRDRRGMKISKSDVEEFSRAVEKDFRILADRYYLSLADDPHIRVSKRKIVITFDVDEAD
jgi:hypothetical protein